MISPEFKIGPLNVHLYGLIIAVAILVGYQLAKSRAKIFKIPKSIFDDPILILPLVIAVIFARSYHVLDHLAYYREFPKEIILINNGGLGIFGGLLGFFIGIYIVSNIKKINTLLLFDLVAPSLILGQAIGRIGNWINQEGFGPPTNLPWRIFIDQSHRPGQYSNFSYFHPTFFYEMALDLLAFAIIMLFSKKLKVPGQVFGLYLVLYSVGRMVAENFRLDTWAISDVKVAYMLMPITFVVGLLLIVKRGVPERKNVTSNGVDRR